MLAIDIKSLTKKYKDGPQALKGIDLEVKKGSFFALLGANGAGKTTIIGILTGLVEKTSGVAKVFGYDLQKDWAKAREQIGVVPQEFNFNQFEKVRDIVLTQAGYFGLTHDDVSDYCETLLKQLDLWEKRNQIARNLSGGMKRRLMIARALINQPKLLILDEPTAGVDVELRHSMWEFIKDLRQQGVTILLTTHYLEEVEQLCEDVAMIKDGQIIANDKVANLLDSLENETYVITVKNIEELVQLDQYNPQKIDDKSFEVEVNRQEDLSGLVEKIACAGMKVTDIRPKANRMEKLFLNYLSS